MLNGSTVNGREPVSIAYIFTPLKVYTYILNSLRYEIPYMLQTSTSGP